MIFINNNMIPSILIFDNPTVKISAIKQKRIMKLMEKIVLLVSPRPSRGLTIFCHFERLIHFNLVPQDTPVSK